MEEWITYTPEAHYIGSREMADRVKMIVRTKFGPAPAEKWRVPEYSEEKVAEALSGTVRTETKKRTAAPVESRPVLELPQGEGD